MKTPIGQLKSKVKVYCTICTSSYTRALKVDIYENTPKEIEMAKDKLRKKANKDYTCNICKSIINN